MKKVFLALIFLNITITRSAFFCCVTEHDQVDDMKKHLNTAKEIFIDPRTTKTKILCRYKARKEDDISWYAQLNTPPPACIGLSEQSRLVGVDDQNNHLIWYEWTIEVKKPGVAEIRLEQYKNSRLQTMQFVRVHVTELS